jgi:cytochrome c553
MSGSNVRAMIGVMLAALFSFVVPAVAQTPTAGSKQAAATTVPFPAWAYPWDPDFKVSPDDGVPRRVPNSSATFTLTQIGDLFFAPDWHPEEHPPVPEIVARGRKPEVRACGCCHRVSGSGGPENSSLAGLPAAYIVQQMADFKSGARSFSGPQRAPILLMNATAKAATDAEVQAAADYFSTLKPKPFIKVVETDTVPETYIAGTHFVTSAAGGKEPLGQRIIEVPVDREQFAHRDGRSQFIAYAPIGSLAKGEVLAKTGGAGTTVVCAVCHGPELKGVGLIPGITGRSPSYVVRQLYEFKQGTRAGVSSALMKPTVEKLSGDDVIALAAYLASLKP